MTYKSITQVLSLLSQTMVPGPSQARHQGHRDQRSARVNAATCTTGKSPTPPGTSKVHSLNLTRKSVTGFVAVHPTTHDSGDNTSRCRKSALIHIRRQKYMGNTYLYHQGSIDRGGEGHCASVRLLFQHSITLLAVPATLRQMINYDREVAKESSEWDGFYHRPSAALSLP